MRRRILIGLLLVLLITGLPSTTSLNKSSYHHSGPFIVFSGDFISIGNDYIKIVITLGNNTGGGLYSVIDKATGTDFITEKKAVGIGFFALDYWSNETIRWEAMLGRNADVIKYTYDIGENGVWINFTWSGLTSTEPGKKFDVSVNVGIHLGTSPLSYWYIRVKNNEPLIIEKITFPLIVGVGQISDEETGDYLVFPGWSGLLFKNPALNFKIGRGIGEVYYPSGMLNLQFIAYYASKKNSGLYLAAYDSTGMYMKAFPIAKDPGQWMWLRPVAIPEFRPYADIALPYPMVLGVFHGDWYDAAMLYKEWAAKQWWASEGPLYTRNDVPSWLKNLGITADVFTRFWARNSVYWNGPYSNIPLIAESMVKYYNTTPLLSWRGWEKNGFGMSPPEVLPPTEGYQEFKKTCSEAYGKGASMLVLPLMSFYTYNASNWEEALKYAPRTRDGSPYTVTYWALNNSGISVKQAGFIMAPTDYWRDTLENLVTDLVNHGVNVVQIDGNPTIPLIDYSNKTGHIGGGTWWAEHYLKMFSTLENSIRRINGDSVLAAEWQAEPYIPYVHLAPDQVNTGLDPHGICVNGCYNSSLNTYIPLWHAVYHEYQPVFSTITIIDGRDFRYYARGLMISLVWGEVPMVDMDPQGTGPPYRLDLYNGTLLAYSKRIADARTTYASPYLIGGKMLRQPIIENAPSILIPGANDIPYSGADVKPFYWSAVTASAWQAMNGSYGIILTSIADSMLNITIKPLIELDNGTTAVYCVVRNGLVEDMGLAEADLLSKINVSINPFDVILISITARKARTLLTVKVSPIIARGKVATITATLKDEWGNPIPDTVIELYVYEEGVWKILGSATTDASGNASLTYVPTATGTAQIKAVFSGTRKYSGNSIVVTTKVLEAYDLTIEVKDPLGFAVSGTEVNLYRDHELAASDVTNVQGRVRFREVPEGKYRVVVTYMGQTISLSVSLFEAKIQTVIVTLSPYTIVVSGFMAAAACGAIAFAISRKRRSSS